MNLFAHVASSVWGRAAGFLFIVCALLVVTFASQLLLLTARMPQPVSMARALRFAASENVPLFLLATLAILVSIGCARAIKSWLQMAFAHLVCALAGVLLVASLQKRADDVVFFVRSEQPARPSATDRPERRLLGPVGTLEGLRVSLASRGPLHLLIYLTVAGLWHGLEMRRAAREKARHADELARRLAEARLEMLRLQLQPHFLLNTLNTIASHVRSEPELAEEMIANLGDLLRAYLAEAAGHEIPLSRELELLESYLAIEKIRFGERLRYHAEIDEAAFDCLVPSLILQPLVENSIRHGIEPRRGPGDIVVRATAAAGQLTLSVSDNGCGFVESSKRGIGLANVRERLNALYGPDSGLAVRPLDAGGVEVALRIPIRRNPAPATTATKEADVAQLVSGACAGP